MFYRCQARDTNRPLCARSVSFIKYSFNNDWLHSINIIIAAVIIIVVVTIIVIIIIIPPASAKLIMFCILINLFFFVYLTPCSNLETNQRIPRQGSSLLKIDMLGISFSFKIHDRPMDVKSGYLGVGKGLHFLNAY